MVFGEGSGVSEDSFDVSEGNSYLIKEETAALAYDIFLNRINSSFKGICITRTRPEILKTRYGLERDIIFLGEQKYHSASNTTLDALSDRIDEFVQKNRRSKILLDRLDYLISMHGFDEVLRFLYALNDLVMQKKAVVLAYVNPATLNNQQIALLLEELRLLKSPRYKEEQELAEDLLEIIEYLRKEEKASFKTIGRQFGITKTTTRNRINKLVSIGIVEIKKSGRNKIVRLKSLD